MALPDFLTPAYMEQIIAGLDKERQFDTPALNLFFKKKVYSDNGFVKVPKEITNYDDLLPLITKGSAIPQSELNMSRDYTTYELKYFGDLKTLNPSEIKRYIDQVAHLTGDTFKSKKAEIVDDIVGGFNNKINATREYMACSALLGDIKDKDGNTIETFDIPTANKLGAKNITNLKLFQIIRDMEKQARKATNYRGKFAIVLGEEAEDKIMATSEYASWVNNGAGMLSTDDALSGIQGFLGNKRHPYLTLDDVYYDKGVAKNFFNPASIMLAPVNAFGEFYGSVETNEGSFAKMKHLDSFEQRNPDGTSYRIQSGSMPIVTLPNGIVTATLTNS